jgi:hypothetical protein
MTIRHQRYVALLALGLVIVAIALRARDAFQGGIFSPRELAGAAGLAPLLVLTLVLVARAGRVEREHGSDYEPPSRGGTTALVLAWGAALALTVVAVWLFLRR